MSPRSRLTSVLAQTRLHSWSILLWGRGPMSPRATGSWHRRTRPLYAKKCSPIPRYRPQIGHYCTTPPNHPKPLSLNDPNSPHTITNWVVTHLVFAYVSAEISASWARSKLLPGANRGRNVPRIPTSLLHA